MSISLITSTKISNTINMHNLLFALTKPNSYLHLKEKRKTLFSRVFELTGCRFKRV